MTNGFLYPQSVGLTSACSEYFHQSVPSYRTAFPTTKSISCTGIRHLRPSGLGTSEVRRPGTPPSGATGAGGEGAMHG
jgi:hypothetical protein